MRGLTYSFRSDVGEIQRLRGGLTELRDSSDKKKKDQGEVSGHDRSFVLKVKLSKYSKTAAKKTFITAI